jgi:hypothetical protein
MPSYTSKKLAFNNAEQFKESFFEPEPSTVGYVFLGRHTPYANEDTPDTIRDTVADEKSVWNEMYAAKKIIGSDLELVLPKIQWTSNKKYHQYDDTIDISTLTTANTVSNTEPCYVINTERNVYLCLCNNVSANSTVEPTGKNLSANGNIQTGDGYLWKYLYNVRLSNRFLTDEWIPVPTSTNKLDYDTSDTISVEGELAKIITTNGGSGYVHSSISVSTFLTGCTVLTIANTTNLSANMALSGTGIAGGTFISSIDPINLTITLSNATSSNGGGSGNTVSVTTRVFIDGDGTGAVGTVDLQNTSIRKITVSSFGSNFTRANVLIFGTGTNAAARAVLPPKFGHGHNPAKQLNASNVMIAMKIGEIDSSENGIISTDTTFRQYGLLRDPHKYGQSAPVIGPAANSVISQTTNLTLVAGSDYNLEEFVYQGVSANTSFFSGTVHASTSNEVRLTNVKGTLQIGSPLKGTQTNLTGRTVVIRENPELEPYTGDVLFVDNITRTERTDGQAENLKFVVLF